MVIKKLSDLGQKIFDQRYAYPGEHGYADRCKAMAKHMASCENEDNKEKWYERFYETLNSGDLIPGGRIIFGSGRNKQNLLNCYGVEPEDNVESIGKILQDMYKISCGGGGIGFNFSKIRPKGDDISNIKNSAPGSVSVMKMINEVGNHVKAGKSRRTALMAQLNVDHPDLLEFLHVKLDLSQLTNFNISVAITDKFIEACESNSDWEFKFNNKTYYVYQCDRVSPNGTSELINIVALSPEDAVNRGKSHHLNHPDDQFLNIEKVNLKALDLWNKLWKNAVESGDPGIFNLSLVNRYTNLSYFLTMNQSNPCHSGNSYLLTDNGYKTFKELFDSKKPVKVVQDNRISYTGPEKDNNNPEHWTIDNSVRPNYVVNQASEVFLTKKRAKVIKLTTTCGIEMVLTPNHHIATVTGGMVEAGKLKPSDMILVSNTQIRDFNIGRESEKYKLGYLYGLFVGDGHHNAYKNCVALQFWGKDKSNAVEVKNIISSLYVNSSNALQEGGNSRKLMPTHTLLETSRGSAIINSTFLKKLFKSNDLFRNDNKFDIPQNLLGNNDFFAGLMSGLVFTDGTVNSGRDSQFSIRLGSINKGFLSTIQRNLLEFGIYGRIYLRKKACNKLMPNGKGGQSEYSCKNFYEIIFDGVSRDKFSELVTLETHKKDKFQRLAAKSVKAYKQKWFAKVKSIEPFGTEDVYCIKEDTRRTIIVNGIANRRCGEIPLDSYANCCLAHVNLSNMVLEETKEIDWKRLARAIRAGIRFLDNTLTVNHYPIPECKVAGERSRRIGLGTLGLHHMLIKLGIKYGSDKCLEFLDRLYATIRDEAYLSSSYLAREKGSFPEFHSRKFLAEEFARTLPARIRMIIKEHGIRNGVMLTAAPTGTISMVHGTSTGIEPIFAPMYKRRYREGNTWRETIVLDPMFREALEKGKDASHIVGAYDITPEQHMAVQAVIQRHIDNSISKTINLPNNANPEEIAKMALKFAPYLKGTTIYRAGSKGQEPLEAIPLTPENIELAKSMIAESKVESEQAVESCKIGGECGA